MYRSNSSTGDLNTSFLYNYRNNTREHQKREQDTAVHGMLHICAYSTYIYVHICTTHRHCIHDIYICIELNRRAKKGVGEGPGAQLRKGIVNFIICFINYVQM